MADLLSQERRSELMARIRSTGTKPEVALYELVRAELGLRWHVERNVRTLPGTPDLYVPAMQLTIFADGCFYHSCPRHGHVPRSNEGYWAPKLARTAKRDVANRRRLRRNGLAVWRFWEHDLKPGPPLERTRQILGARLAKRRRHMSETF